MQTEPPARVVDEATMAHRQRKFALRLVNAVLIDIGFYTLPAVDALLLEGTFTERRYLLAIIFQTVTLPMLTVQAQTAFGCTAPPAPQDKASGHTKSSSKSSASARLAEGNADEEAQPPAGTTLRTRRVALQSRLPASKTEDVLAFLREAAKVQDAAWNACAEARARRGGSYVDLKSLRAAVREAIDLDAIRRRLDTIYPGAGRSMYFSRLVDSAIRQFYANAKAATWPHARATE